MPAPIRHPAASASTNDHDHGLAQDLLMWQAGMAQRRRALRWLGAGLGLGVLPLVGCKGGGDVNAATTGSTGLSGRCAVIPEETAGPFPGNGSNRSNGRIANALALSGIVRSDIRSSLGGLTGTAGGVPLTLTLRLVDTHANCADLSGYALYLWHCDRDGHYSMYSSATLDQNYLRGVQATDGRGSASFVTVFPGCYDGRMPHMHFEVYRSLATATTATSKLKTSQIAFPTDVCQTVYATSGYETSARNLARISFATDFVFRDGVSLQTATMTGSMASGYMATLTVGIGA